jgi:uncharacterized protein YqeY
MTASSATALRDRIAEDVKAAMKAREKARLAALRLISAEIKRVEVDERKELSDADVVAVLNKMLKQRAESEQQFRAAGRIDLADGEAFEIALLRGYMPAAMSDADLDGAIKDVIGKLGASSIRDMGKVMNELRPRVQGRVDMAVASARVKALLSGA